MKTTNGYKYTKRGNIITLFIPKTQGIYTPEVQEAHRQIILLGVEFKELRIEKLPLTKAEFETINNYAK